jgi:hypothetical protein
MICSWRYAYLVTIAPSIVLVPDVLVGILDALFQRGHVVPMFPMLVPQVIGVDCGESNARDHEAARLLVQRGSDTHDTGTQWTY